jgi:hypothetical protein
VRYGDSLLASVSGQEAEGQATKDEVRKQRACGALPPHEYVRRRQSQRSAHSGIQIKTRCEVEHSDDRSSSTLAGVEERCSDRVSSPHFIHALEVLGPFCAPARSVTGGLDFGE